MPAPAVRSRRKPSLPVNGMDDSPRGKLLSAAARLFRDQGYERTTVRDIAALVGIQSGSLFHHFRSKEEILKAVMIEVIRFNTNRLRNSVAGKKDVRGRLRALIECELQSIVGDTREAMGVLVYCWEGLSPESREEVLQLRAVYEGIWMDVLGQAHADGIVRTDPFVLRRLLTGAINWSSTWFDPHGPMSFDALVDTLLGMAIRS